MTTKKQKKQNSAAGKKPAAKEYPSTERSRMEMPYDVEVVQNILLERNLLRGLGNLLLWISENVGLIPRDLFDAESRESERLATQEEVENRRPSRSRKRRK
jgi:hypothetical protein